MQLFLQHKPYRVLTLSILLGIFGTTLFDLVSVLYAATSPIQNWRWGWRV